MKCLDTSKLLDSTRSGDVQKQVHLIELSLSNKFNRSMIEFRQSSIFMEGPHVTTFYWE
jgi:hypothetical protein